MALRELLASFSIETGQAQSALKSLDSKVQGAAGQLGGLVEGFGAYVSGGALKEFVLSTIEAGGHLNDMAEKLGVGTDELQSFQFAAGLVGVEADEAGRALQFLNKNIGDALTGNAEAAQSFKKLGVDIKAPDGTVRELGDVIPEVADAFAKMGSDQERTAQAMKLFGKSGASLLPILKQGGEGLAAMQKEFEELGGGMSKDAVQAFDKTGDAIDKLKFGLRSVKSAIVAGLLPYVDVFVDKATGWVKSIVKMTKETNLVRYAVALFGVVAGATAFKAAGAFGELFGLFSGGKTTIARMLISFGPIGAIIALVGILFLVFEDLFTAVQGGESFIVSLVEKFLGVNEANALVSELSAAWEAVQQAVKPLSPLLDEVGAYISKIATDYAPKVLQVFVDIVKTVAQAITKVADFFGLLNSENTGQVRADVLQRRAEGLAARTAPTVAFDALPKVPGAAGGGANVNVNQTNRTEVNVQGGSSPQATGAAVGGAVKDAYQANLNDAYQAYAGD